MSVAHRFPLALTPKKPRGRQKQIDGPPRTFAKSQTHPSSNFFFLVCFWAFLGKESSKVHVENFYQKKSTKVFLDFVLSRFRVFLKTHTHKMFCILQKHRVQKLLQRNRPKTHVFEGSSKTRQSKYRKNKSDPAPFSYSDPPTTHGGHRLFFLGPAHGPLGEPRRVRRQTGPVGRLISYTPIPTH
jgi:hypothetical protein